VKITKVNNVEKFYFSDLKEGDVFSPEGVGMYLKLHNDNAVDLYHSCVITPSPTLKVRHVYRNANLVLGEPSEKETDGDDQD